MGVSTSKKDGLPSSSGTSGAVCSVCSTALNSSTPGCFNQNHHLICEGSKHMPWSKVSSEVLTTWKYGAVLWGFDPRIDYTSNVKGRLQPWCTSGRHFVVTHDSPNKILQRPYCLMTITENCLKQDTHVRLPYAYAGRLYAESEPAGHYLKSAQVVGYRNGIALLQLNCMDNLMEFVAVHMKTASILAIHKEETFTGKHYLCDCIISPDLGSFILKPNAMYVLNFCRGEFRNVMKVLSLKENRCPVLKSIFPNLAVRLFAAYDPRYCWSRVALGNYSKGGRDVLCVYDIKEDKVILESSMGHYQTTHNIVFSPDGRYIASLILGRSIKDGLFNFPKVLVYSSDTLEVVHFIRTEYLAEVPTLSPAAIFPLFSDTGERMAVAYGEQGTFYQQVVGVHLYRVPTAFDLQSLCREEIRRRFDCQDVQRLPLPNQMKSFLAFKPYYE